MIDNWPWKILRGPKGPSFVVDYRSEAWDGDEHRRAKNGPILANRWYRVHIDREGCGAGGDRGGNRKA